MKITENNIIESLKSGEEQAFRYIYDKYYGYLCAIENGSFPITMRQKLL